MLKKLSQKWNIKSKTQLVVILFVFAINGSLSVMLVKPVMNYINLSESTTSPFIFWPLRIVLMFIIYQILLVIIGTLFGQHKFFWNMEKKMLIRLGFGKFFKNENYMKTERF